jgi:DNA-binding NarL/FixJ family response regulator
MLKSLEAQFTQVAIIEDDRRIREGLQALINGTEGYRCTAAFRSMEEALLRPWPEVPDVVLVDIGLPGMSGVEGLGVLHERYPEAALVMLTVYEDDERIFDALCAGACGYLLKRIPPARLLESLREAKLGRCSHVSGGGTARDLALSRRAPAGRRRTRSHAARDTAAQAAGGWTQLQIRGCGDGRQLPHHRFSHPQHLRKNAGAFEIRSGGQGTAASVDVVTTDTDSLKIPTQCSTMAEKRESKPF